MGQKYDRKQHDYSTADDTENTFRPRQISQSRSREAATPTHVLALPREVLVHTADLYRDLADEAHTAIHAENISVDHAALLNKKNAIVSQLREGIEKALKAGKIDVFKGHAVIENNQTVCVNDELIEAYATLPKVCHYVDLPLQHASDRLLHAMRRRDKLSETKKLLKKLRERIPDIVIRTTFIVGFPGETEEDFAILKEFVTEQKFENAGVFQYSQEENTVAATLPEQIPEEIKQERYDELMAIQAGISEKKRTWLQPAVTGKRLI